MNPLMLLAEATTQAIPITPVSTDGVPPWLVYVTIALIPAVTAFCLAVVIPMMNKQKEIKEEQRKIAEAAALAAERAARAEGVATGQSTAIKANADAITGVNQQITSLAQSMPPAGSSNGGPSTPGGV